jgi:hypothetical protein
VCTQYCVRMEAACSLGCLWGVSGGFLLQQAWLLDEARSTQYFPTQQQSPNFTAAISSCAAWVCLPLLLLL